MAVLYLDTSALVRRYDSTEPAAAQVRAACVPARGNDLLICELTSVEVAAALSMKRRTGQVPAARVARLWRRFRTHRARQYQTIGLTLAQVGRAEELTFQVPVKALYALHIAAALAASSASPTTPLTFWTADRQQAHAARTAGLDVYLVG